MVAASDQAVAKDSSSPPAITQVGQDYTYQSQFGSLGTSNGQFNRPISAAIDPANHNIVVADKDNNRVQTFNSAGAYLSQFGTAGSGNGQLTPFGVAIDPTTRNIAITDSGNARVQIFNSAGIYLSQFGSSGTGDGQFTYPWAIAIDPTSHNIVVVDAPTRVQIFNSTGAFLGKFGTLGRGNGQFDFPLGVAIDPTSHNIVVTDGNNGRVQIFSSAGGYLSQFGTNGSGNGQLISPEGVAIDPTSHNIAVADRNNHRVQLFNSTGIYLGQFGAYGSGNGQFNSPEGVTIDSTSHNIVVVDSGNNRVQIFNKNAFLNFPLAAVCNGIPCTPFTARISAVMDHSGTPLDPVNNPGHFYVADGKVQAFTGEVGEITFGENCIPGPGYKNQDGTDFLANSLNYVGTASCKKNELLSPDADTNPKRFLNYDGHSGYDYSYPKRTPIVAPAGGQLFKATVDDVNHNRQCPFNGWKEWHTFYIVHENGYSTWYLHADELEGAIDKQIGNDFTKSVTVNKGEVVGFVGQFGKCFGVGQHLHFEVRHGLDQVVDPYSDGLWITP
jgi:DNA-binding beta-propeller fold protein YncE